MVIANLQPIRDGFGGAPAGEYKAPFQEFQLKLAGGTTPLCRGARLRKGCELKAHVHPPS
jgi:hypothetical protein